jgi:zinc transport system permease protein
MNMIEQLMAAFRFEFMWFALLVGISVAITSAILGSFLVLKKFAMLGHGLSHVAFAAVALSVLLNQSPLLLTLPIVILASIFILRLNNSTKLHGDAATGILAAFSLAFGTIIVSTGGGFNVDIYSYLFGSILTIRVMDVYTTIIFSLLIIGFVLYFFNDLFSLTFDENYAGVSKVKVKWLNIALAIMTGIIVSVGIRAIGTLLISSLLIFPIIIAVQFNQGFKVTILLATIISVLSVVVGLLASFLLDFPTGATIVVIKTIVYVSVIMIKSLLKLR